MSPFTYNIVFFKKNYKVEKFHLKSKKKENKS